MNFDCVGRDSKGQMHMKFREPFNIVEKIQLLQRWILVQSFAYYELNDNIASDFKYDANARQLEDMARSYPEEFMRSRYWDYFYDFFDASEHATSGFDLLERVKKADKDLYRRLHMDAANALTMKSDVIRKVRKQAMKSGGTEYPDILGIIPFEETSDSGDRKD